MPVRILPGGDDRQFPLCTRAGEEDEDHSQAPVASKGKSLERAGGEGGCWRDYE